MKLIKILCQLTIKHGWEFIVDEWDAKETKASYVLSHREFRGNRRLPKENLNHTKHFSDFGRFVITTPECESEYKEILKDEISKMVVKEKENIDKLHSLI